MRVVNFDLSTKDIKRKFCFIFLYECLYFVRAKNICIFSASVKIRVWNDSGQSWRFGTIKIWNY